jgi:predicted phage terminase large subunit-like protein
MNAITVSDYEMFLRHDFVTFIDRSFAHLHPQTAFALNWHIELVAHWLEKVRLGHCRRLILNVPPRNLKSICASVAFPAWILGHDPTHRIVCASYGQDLANKLARDCHALMSSPWYQRIFATRLAPNRSAVADFETTQQGGRMATSVGGVLTGRGGDLIIIDDPIKPDEALSAVQRQTANDWFDNTLYSRLNDKQTGAIVIIMQRLHLDDLVGHVMAQEQWEVVSLPAIADQDETWQYMTVGGPVTHHRPAGTALHPEREPLAILDVLQKGLGEYVFSAQYLQSPVPLGGGMVKIEWLKFYRPGELPPQFDTVIQSWDSANKESELADFSVCTTWGIKDKDIYLLDVYRERVNYPDLKRAVVRLAEQHRAKVVLIEDKASGTQLIQELVREGLSQVKGVKPLGDKIMRMQAQTPPIENGFVRFPESASWLATYVQELTTFPKAKYDDQVDSTAQALAWFSEYGSEPGIIGYYRMLIAEQRNMTVEQVREMIEKQRKDEDEANRW